MKTLIIYNSIHNGNTEKIAKAIAKILKAKLAKPNELNIKELTKYDLIGFGSGIYAFRHHKSLLNLINKFPATYKKAFIFSTSGFPLLSPIWHSSLKTKLLKKGFIIIGEFSCKGFDRFGPWKLIGGINKNRPDKKDIEKAEDFAKKLIGKKVREK